MMHNMEANYDMRAPENENKTSIPVRGLADDEVIHEIIPNTSPSVPKLMTDNNLMKKPDEERCDWLEANETLCMPQPPTQEEKDGLAAMMKKSQESSPMD